LQYLFKPGGAKNSVSPVPVNWGFVFLMIENSVAVFLSFLFSLFILVSVVSSVLLG